MSAFLLNNPAVFSLPFGLAMIIYNKYYIDYSEVFLFTISLFGGIYVRQCR